MIRDSLPPFLHVQERELLRGFKDCRQRTAHGLAQEEKKRQKTILGPVNESLISSIRGVRKVTLEPVMCWVTFPALFGGRLPLISLRHFNSVTILCSCVQHNCLVRIIFLQSQAKKHVFFLQDICIQTTNCILLHYHRKCSTCIIHKHKEIMWIIKKKNVCQHLKFQLLSSCHYSSNGQIKFKRWNNNAA